MNKFYSPCRTRVKICGLTRPEDAISAAQLGADAIGLVFYPPSARNVDIVAARSIVACLPAFVSVVALFVDEVSDRITQVLEKVNIDLLQFHGDESPGFCRSFGVPYIKVVRMADQVDLDEIQKQYSDARGLLLDAYHPDEKGGTGISFDWARIPDNCHMPIILAGGLSSENVQRAIASVHPYAVDVSSGVESAKGRKDVAKMVGFLNEVNELERAR